MNRRSFLVTAIAAAFGAKELMAQESVKKLSNGDLEDRLNSQLGALLESAKTRPELQGLNIPPINIKVVKPAKQKYDDIEVVRSDKSNQTGAVTFLLARDTLDALETPEKQRALVANALSEHILKLGGERLGQVGITDYAKNIQGPSAFFGPETNQQDRLSYQRTFANFLSPLRADELAITLMMADKSSPTKNNAFDYLGMLGTRQSQEEKRSDDFMKDMANAKPPKDPKNEKDEVKLAQKAREAVGRMNQINGQSFGIGADGQFNANVPIDYNRRMDQVLEVHPESNVVKTPAPSKPYDNPLRRPLQR